MKVTEKQFANITGGTSKVPPLLSEHGLKNIEEINSNRDWRATPIEGWRGVDSLDAGEAPKKNVTP
jgi:hypothetical protein